MEKIANTNKPITHVIIAKSDLILVDKYKEQKRYPTRTLAIRELLELGYEYQQIKDKVTDNQISKILLSN